jgi:hypothetical protein
VDRESWLERLSHSDFHPIHDGRWTSPHDACQDSIQPTFEGQEGTPGPAMSQLVDDMTPGKEQVNNTSKLLPLLHLSKTMLSI